MNARVGDFHLLSAAHGGRRRCLWARSHPKSVAALCFLAAVATTVAVLFSPDTGLRFHRITPSEISGMFAVPGVPGHLKLAFNATKTLDETAITIGNQTHHLLKFRLRNATLRGDNSSLKVFGRTFVEGDRDVSANETLHELLTSPLVQALPSLMEAMHTQKGLNGGDFPQLLLFYGFARAAYDLDARLETQQEHAEKYSVHGRVLEEYEWKDYGWMEPNKGHTSSTMRFGGLNRLGYSLGFTSMTCSHEHACADSCTNLNNPGWPSSRGYQCYQDDTQVTVETYLNPTSTTSHGKCMGLCGPACCCWKWACGDCCAHPACMFHDTVSCQNPTSLACVTGNWGGFKCWGQFPYLHETYT